MNTVNNILNKAFKNAHKVKIDKDSKIIFFSDLHKGDNSYAHDFKHNMYIYEFALKDYYNKDFTYIEGTDKNIFVLHGHQADYMNYIHWKFNRFFVRYLWKYLQKWFGISDPTSPAKNYSE